MALGILLVVQQNPQVNTPDIITVNMNTVIEICVVPTLHELLSSLYVVYMILFTVLV